MRIAYRTPWRVTVTLIAGAMLIACRPAPAPAPGAASDITVEVAIAAPSIAADIARLPGRLEPYRRAEVRARVAGIVQKRVYTEGEEVRAGDLLFSIDPAQLDADLAAAEAELAQAQAATQAANDLAQRSRELVDDHAISTQQYRKDFFAEKQARAMEQSAVAKLRSARLNRAYANVTSPIAGRARKAMVSEGTMVGQDESTLLTTVEQLDPIYVDFSQPVAEFLALQQRHVDNPKDAHSQTVSLLLANGTRYTLAGTLKFSDSAVNAKTDTVALRAVFANPDHLLLPGMYVQVELERARTGNAVLIPQRALTRGRNGAYVMVEDKGLARQIKVQADSLEGQQWRVEAGLFGGEKVILEGGGLRDGQPVKIKQSALSVGVSRS